MECWHNRISLKKGYPHCLDCKKDFKHGELGKIRQARKQQCSHPNLEYGYASNPPMAWCHDCHNYIRYITDRNGKPVKEGDTIVFTKTDIPYKVVTKNGLLGAYEDGEFIALKDVLKNFVKTN
ncbi:hypothetical protein CHH61_03290 [Shouchella clausii]|uniref:Uncharacterized protein n=1 Tax=Shouchella clausii TaxID=79880 RepID=A0A268S4F6_SHOCL|nr:hypothetical protein [Shouchella clausii]PAF27433.1 hypothetical protein CHH61_03290 [Shouchella clausii]